MTSQKKVCYIGGYTAPIESFQLMGLMLYNVFCSLSSVIVRVIVVLKRTVGDSD